MPKMKQPTMIYGRFWAIPLAEAMPAYRAAKKSKEAARFQIQAELNDAVQRVILVPGSTFDLDAVDLTGGAEADSTAEAG